MSIIGSDITILPDLTQKINLEVHRNRTNVSIVKLGYNVSGMNFISQIRAERTRTSRLIATWSIEVVGDGSSGELRFSLDNGITRDISDNIGYMDIVREEGGEPYSVLRTPLVVAFLDFPTEPSPDPEP
jgi:hypothetical protein